MLAHFLVMKSIRFTNMSRFFVNFKVAIVFSILFFLISCASTKDSNSAIIRALELRKLVGNDLNNKIFNGRKINENKFDTIFSKVYLLGNRVQMNVEYNQINLKTDSLVGFQKREFTFVFTRGNKTGYIYDKFRNWSKVPVDVDSTLSKLWFNNANIYQSIINSKVKVHNIKNENLNFFNEYYTLVPNSDTLAVANVELNYNRELLWFPFSFSKELDSIHKAKLTEIKVELNYLKPAANGEFPEPINLQFKMKEIRVKNKDEIMKYFD